MSKQITQGLPAGLRIIGAEEREEDREEGLRASSWGQLADDAVGVGAAKEIGGTRERTIVVVVFEASWA